MVMRRFFGSTFGSSGLPYTPLLDVYGADAYCAHSIRKERTAYNGPCLRAIRDSDNAELDIDFDSDGLIDTAALLSFAGAGTVRMKTWYDQTVNGKDLILASTFGASLVVLGVLSQESGTPVVRFPPGNSSYYTFNHSGELNNTASKSLFLTMNGGATSGFYTGTRGITVTGWMYRQVNSTLNYQYFFTGGTGIIGTPAKPNGRKIYNFTHTDAVNGARLVLNNSLVISGRPTGGSDRSIYEFSRDSGAFSVMDCFNHIIYSADKVADETGINGNINDYFNVY